MHIYTLLHVFKSYLRCSQLLPRKQPYKQFWTTLLHFELLLLLLLMEYTCCVSAPATISFLYWILQYICREKCSYGVIFSLFISLTLHIILKIIMLWTYSKCAVYKNPCLVYMTNTKLLKNGNRSKKNSYAAHKLFATCTFRICTKKMKELRIFFQIFSHRDRKSLKKKVHVNMNRWNGMKSHNPCISSLNVNNFIWFHHIIDCYFLTPHQNSFETTRKGVSPDSFRFDNQNNKINFFKLSRICDWLNTAHAYTFIGNIKP